MELNYPTHVGIIMDGNGRWAVNRGLPRSLGHKEGANTLKELLLHIYKTPIKYVSIYAFSTENFKRENSEVSYLMNLFVTLFKSELDFLKELEVKVVFSGRRDKLPSNVLKAMDKLTSETKDFTKGYLNVCLNYGGQYEIVDMVKKLIDKGYKKEEITKELVEENLYQNLPPLDFVIRTSGEKRNSNFMIYQSAYAEYYYPETLFPDFKEKEFDLAISEYNKRKRRFGGN